MPDPDDAGYGAAREGDVEDAPDQAQQRREPPSDEEDAQDDYANAGEHTSPPAT
ncbi:MAG TPA: hypothetical protein VFO64_06165 [Gaiellaceae bacterium]|nr:hypothetical protein [Gaiellaceae bacterium]